MEPRQLDFTPQERQVLSRRLSENEAGREDGGQSTEPKEQAPPALGHHPDRASDEDANECALSSEGASGRSLVIDLSDKEDEPAAKLSEGNSGSSLVTDPSDEEDEPEVPTLVYTLPSFEQEPATPEQVVHFLVSNGYLLSALELVVEATDEEAVQRLLAPFFGNPDFFPPDQIAKCTGDDDFRLAAQLKEQGRALDVLQDRAALSEYELRLAKEDVRELTERVSNEPGEASRDGGLAAEHHEAASEQKGPGTPGDAAGADGAQGALLHREELNSTVIAYLSTSGYHLTAMAFEDEAAGQFDRSRRGRGRSGAGRDSGKSDASLIAFFKAFKEADGLRQQAQEASAEAEGLREALGASRSHADELQASLDRVDMEAQCLRGDIEVLSRQLEALQAQQQQQQRDAAAHPPEVSFSPPESPSSTAGGDASAVTASFRWRKGTIHAVEALRVVADYLPRIVPSILINARQELLPVLLAVIQEHPDPAARLSLSKLLFNLIKKPDQAQRKMIVEGCRELSSRIGPERTMDELLPQCWEQLNDKYPERRILVAEACGHLSPFLSAQIRQSLLLGMLGQLADDRKPAVRASAAANLALVLPGLEDKYEQVEEILFELCMDVSDEVQEASLLVLLPAVVVWARPSGRVCESLIPGVLGRMQSVLETAPTLAGLRGMEAALADLRILGPIQQDQLRVLLQMWVALLEELRASAATSCPQWVCEAAAKQLKAQPSPSSAASGSPEVSNGVYYGSFSLDPGAIRASDDPADNPFAGSPRGRGAPAAAANPFGCVDGDEDSPRGSNGGTNNPFEASSTNPFDETEIENKAPGNGNGHANNPFEAPSPRGSLREDQGPGYSSNPFANDPPAEDEAAPSPLFSAHANGGSEAYAESPSCSSPDSCQKQAAREAAARFSAWALLTQQQRGAEDSEEAGAGASGGRWGAAEWLVREGLPGLIACFRMVHPSESLELLRQDFCACMRATCDMTGSEFASSVIVPLFTAAICSPAATGEAPVVIAEAARHVAPLSDAAEHVARVTLLPVLLGGVLPCAGPSALREYLGLMLDEGGDGQQDDAASYDARSWAVEHRGDVSKVLAFAARIGDVQMELLRTMHCLVAAPGAASRQGAALLGTALAWSLEAEEVERRLLPALTRLTEDRSRKVRMEVVNAVSEVCRRHYRESASLASKLEMLLDNLIMERGPQHDVQMAIFNRLAEGAPFATPEQVEFLLHKILWLLSSIAQRNTCGKPPTQLAETAAVVFDCLRAVDTSDAQLWQHHNLQLHMLSALTCLQREAELLDSSRREILSAMLRDHRASTPSVDFVPGEARFSDSGSGSGSRVLGR